LSDRRGCKKEAAAREGGQTHHMKAVFMLLTVDNGDDVEETKPLRRVITCCWPKSSHIIMKKENHP
jgi:hypothetical protein